MDTYPMKWYKFVIYVQLFLSAVLNVISAVMYITGSAYQGHADEVYSYFPVMRILDIVMGLACIALAVFAVIVRQKLARFKSEGPRQYLIFLGANLTATILYIIIATVATGINMVNINSIAQVIMGVVMIAVNKKYFENRQDLFVY